MLKDYLKRNKWRFIGFGLLFAGIMAAFQYALTPEDRLAVLNPTDFDRELVDDSKVFVKKYHKIAPFELINQNGDTITEKDYKGKIYVASFFFTTCPTICPVMTENMTIIQEEFKNDPEVMLLSHSVTPRRDSVPVLRAYADARGIEDDKWNIVTGEKEQIYSLARKSYMTVKDAPYGGEYDMIHTENFMLVDKQGRLRGRSYDGTKLEEIQALIEDIYILKRSYADDD